VKAKNAKSADPKISIVSRQMSPNSDASRVMPSALESVPDFVAAYTTTDKTIADLTASFVDAADLAKQKQDLIVPQLSLMQSLLSKKGVNHRFVIEARQQGENIPWWGDYYDSYKDKLWESLRTMERRIAQYRIDPSLPKKKPPASLPQLRKSDRIALVDAAGIGTELVTALEKGGDPSPFAARYKQVVTRKRLDNILHVGNVESEEDRYKETLSRITQNHRNHINALANQLAGMVVEKKAHDEMFPLAQKIAELYRESLQPRFFDEKAKWELSHPVAVGTPGPKVKSNTTTNKKPPTPVASEKDGQLATLASQTPRSGSATATSKLMQAEEWLRRYLANGPMPIPDSYIKNGLCRYNYPPDALPPEGVGKKTIDKAILNLGVERIASGPRGGMRWHLPNKAKEQFGTLEVTISGPPQSETENDQD